MNKKILLVGGVVALAGALFLFGGKGASEQSMGGSFGGVDTSGYANELAGGTEAGPTYIFNTQFPEQAVSTSTPEYTSAPATSSFKTQPIYSGINQNSSLSKVTTPQQGVAVALGVPVSYINPNVNTATKVSAGSAGLINYINPNILAGASTIKSSKSTKGPVYSGVNQNASKSPAVTKVPTTVVTNKSSPSVIKKTATNYFLRK